MEIYVKKSSIVRPAQETPTHRLWNSDLDLVVTKSHVLTVHFYRRPSDCSNFFEPGVLKEALSNVLVWFYPMAGRFGRDENGRLEIVCNAEGVLFVEAETTSVIDDLGDFTPSSKHMRLVPIPKIDSGDISSHPFVVLQVTSFKCGGVCLGFGLHHFLVDGTSAIHFINTFANMTRGLPISVPPFLDRTIIRGLTPSSPTFQHTEYHPPPSMIKELQSGPGPTSIATLKLSLDQINTLKSKINQHHHETKIKYSSFEILAAHMWRSLCKARGLSDDQASKLYLAINGRSRLNPPIPSGYMGNVVFHTAPIALSGDIQSKPFISTVERIREAINRMDNDYLRSALAYLAQRDDLIKPGGPAYKCPNLKISSWTRMPIYDADFGWGRPMFMGRAIICFDGSSYILPSPSYDGTLSVIICLDGNHMELFKKFFYDF